MRQQIATASRTIAAPPAEIYQIIADYRTLHPMVLPKPYFLSLDVEEGGYGAGTIVNFSMRILGKIQSFRSLITEPEPGRVLLETDLNSGIATRFSVQPLTHENRTQVTIGTVLKNRSLIEGYVAKALLQRIYRKELELLARLAEDHEKLGRSVTSNQAG
ncbi:MAG TPA: SRPBCC family protein [Anaerolineales bacterium]|nr:SRPBCC family protein [Anaerolineales bacterium]